MSVFAGFVVNGESARVHQRFESGVGQVADLPRCNLDQIANRHNCATAAEVYEVLGRRRPRLCRWCDPVLN